MRILVPVDGSDNSVRAAEYALKLAKNHKNTEVTLVSVPCSYETSFFIEVPYPLGNVSKGCKQAFEEKLDNIKKIFDDAGVPVSAKLLKENDPARAISEYAESSGYDKIVMGSRGLSPLQGMVLGSVTYKVLNTVKIPVTIIK